MLPDRVSNPEPLTYESDALPIALRGPADLNCPPTLVKGDYSNGSVRPSFRPSVRTQSCLRNFSYSFQGILMKLSRYRSLDLKMIIFYRGCVQLIFTRVMAL